MIKLIGIVFFALIAVGMIYFGVEQAEPVAWQIGAFLLAVIVLITILVKAFPQYFDSEEKGREGMKVIKHAAKRAFKEFDD